MSNSTVLVHLGGTRLSTKLVSSGSVNSSSIERCAEIPAIRDKPAQSPWEELEFANLGACRMLAHSIERSGRAIKIEPKPSEGGQRKHEATGFWGLGGHAGKARVSFWELALTDLSRLRRGPFSTVRELSDGFDTRFGPRLASAAGRAHSSSCSCGHLVQRIVSIFLACESMTAACRAIGVTSACWQRRTCLSFWRQIREWNPKWPSAPEASGESCEDLRSEALLQIAANPAKPLFAGFLTLGTPVRTVRGDRGKVHRFEPRRSTGKRRPQAREGGTAPAVVAEAASPGTFSLISGILRNPLLQHFNTDATGQRSSCWSNFGSSGSSSGRCSPCKSGPEVCKAQVLK